LWIIDPPYGLGHEEWDRVAFGQTEFDNIFKKIQALDNRSLSYVLCFGPIRVLAAFETSAQVYIFLKF